MSAFFGPQTYRLPVAYTSERFCGKGVSGTYGIENVARRRPRPPIPITDQCFNRAEAIAMSKSYVSGLPASLLVSAVASGSLQVMLMAEILEREGQKSAWFNPPASDLEATPSPESRPA